MANSATALTVVPFHIKLGQPKGLLNPVVVVSDSVGNLDLFTPSAGYAACVGMVISESGGFTGSIKSDTTDLFNLEIAASAQPIFRPVGEILFVGEKGKKIVLANASGAITKALFYFTELERLVSGF